MRPLIRAVAGLLCVGDEILLVRRADASPAFPGYWACPGGKVEADEATLPPKAAYCGLDLTDLAALRRELQEELGFDLHEHPVRIHCLGRAHTPPGQPRRFDTAFFRIDLAEKPSLTPDLREHSDVQWGRASDYWAHYLRGELLCVSPLQRILSALHKDPATTEVADIGHRPGQDIGLNLSEPLHGVRIIPLRSHTLPPATHTNAFLLGDSGSAQILVDPSPADAEEYQRLCDLLTQIGWPQTLFLTHHHPDHHERAPKLAREHGLSMAMSADTAERLRQRFGADYLEGIPLRCVNEGDTLCTWLGHRVEALAVPGHDAGHLALMPESRHWMIVGDLYQGVGSVVIGKPEGNMAAYFASLQKVIDLDPLVTIPSHGIALPGTRQIRLTLAHRQARERHIGALHAQGLSVEAILEQEYAEVPRALWPLARLNIEGHLEKLAAERTS